MMGARSVSFNDDVLYEVQHKAKEMGIDFSKAINELLKKSLFEKQPEQESDDIPLLINKLIIINNKLIIIEKDITERLKMEKSASEAKVKKAELDLLERKKEQIARFEYLENTIKGVKMMEKVLKIDKNADINAENSPFFIKKYLIDNQINLSLADILEFLRLKELIQCQKK